MQSKPVLEMLNSFSTWLFNQDHLNLPYLIFGRVCGEKGAFCFLDLLVYVYLTSI